MWCENDVSWLYRLARSHAWESGLPVEKDIAFRDKKGRVRLVLEKGGRVIVMRGYAWNGCSPKFCLFDLLVGTPDGVVDVRTGRPKTYFASLVHDALCQFLPDGLPLSRGDVDRCFLALLAESGFRPRWFYFVAVRAFGGIVVPLLRIMRGTKGSAVQL
jgi:hypothetical protein